MSINQSKCVYERVTFCSHFYLCVYRSSLRGQILSGTNLFNSHLNAALIITLIITDTQKHGGRRGCGDAHVDAHIYHW